MKFPNYTKEVMLNAVIYSMATTAQEASKKYGMSDKTIYVYKKKFKEEGRLKKYMNKPKEHQVFKDIREAENNSLSLMTAQIMGQEPSFSGSVEVIDEDTFIQDAKSVRARLLRMIEAKLMLDVENTTPMKDLTDTYKAITQSLSKVKEETSTPKKRNNDFIKQMLLDNQESIQEALAMDFEDIKPIKDKHNGE